MRSSRFASRLVNTAASVGLILFMLAVPTSASAAERMVISWTDLGRLTHVGNLETHPGSGYATFNQAKSVFGSPGRLSGTRRGSQQCTARWSTLSLRLKFVHRRYRTRRCGGVLVGGAAGSSSSVTWVTQDGLAIGDSLTRLRELYPSASEGEVDGVKVFVIANFVEAGFNYGVWASVSTSGIVTKFGFSNTLGEG